jgi:hypothetical protein
LCGLLPLEPFQSLFYWSCFQALISPSLRCPARKGRALPVVAQQSEHGFHATMGSEVLDVTVCGELSDPRAGKARCRRADRAKALDARSSQSCAGAPFQFTQDAKSATLKTDKLEVTFGS